MNYFYSCVSYFLYVIHATLLQVQAGRVWQLH